METVTTVTARVLTTFDMKPSCGSRKAIRTREIVRGREM
jgi:hypothetical protein